MAKDYRTYSEKELLDGIKSRDNELVEFMSREYRPSIRLLIHRMGGSHDDAKDVFQDGIIELIKMSEDPSFQLKSAIKTLLYAICKNRWKNRLREKKRVVSYNPEHHDVVVEPDFEEKNDMGLYEKLFWGTFNTLSKTCRKVLLLHFRDHQNSEIARLLNLSVGYVRKRKSLCTRKMIERIKRNSEYHKLMASPNVSLNE